MRSIKNELKYSQLVTLQHYLNTKAMYVFLEPTASKLMECLREVTNKLAAGLRKL